MKIKICGITNIEDARCAAEAGAEFLGFIFYPPSPRNVSVVEAGRIVRSVRQAFGAESPTFVGVFVDESPAGVRAAIEGAGLDLVQLHGHEPPEMVRALQPFAFKALRPRTLEEVEAAFDTYRDVVPQQGKVPQFLIDAYDPDRYGGTGERADGQIARRLAGQCRLMLAGGLTPETVGAAIEQVRPWGVDVSSGVEREKGRKDHARVRAFVDAVRAVG